MCHLFGNLNKVYACVVVSMLRSARIFESDVVVNISLRGLSIYQCLTPTCAFEIDITIENDRLFVYIYIMVYHNTKFYLLHLCMLTTVFGSSGAGHRC